VKLKRYQDFLNESEELQEVIALDDIVQDIDLDISEGLNYHIEYNKSIEEPIYRYSSQAYYKLINEMSALYHQGIYKPQNEVEEEILLEAATGLYKGKKVQLNSPKRGGSKKFYVYVNSGKKNAEGRVVAKKVCFGDTTGLRIKNKDPKAAKAFRARHRCSEKTDKTTAGYWSCNVGRYAKALGLSSNQSW
jgi:hypothetical protein